MTTMALWTVWGWIGWLTTTVILGAVFLVTGVLGTRVFERLRRVYHLSVISYWLDRLEQEGKRVFMKANEEPSPARVAPRFDLVEHLHRQKQFSENTFGPGTRTAGLCDHMRKELKEIEADPGDLMEWVDMTMLALDGAWRAGYTPEQIAEALSAKLAKNEQRQWPDWRTADPDKAIEHVRT